MVKYCRIDLIKSFFVPLTGIMPVSEILWGLVRSSIPKHVMDGKLVGAIGVPNLDGVPSTVRVVREGPLLIVDESDEPEF